MHWILYAFALNLHLTGERSIVLGIIGEYWWFHEGFGSDFYSKPGLTSKIASCTRVSRDHE